MVGSPLERWWEDHLREIEKEMGGIISHVGSKSYMYMKVEQTQYNVNMLQVMLMTVLWDALRLYRSTHTLSFVNVHIHGCCISPHIHGCCISPHSTHTNTNSGSFVAIFITTCNAAPANNNTPFPVVNS